MDPMGKCLLSLQLCGFQDLCKRGIFLNMQVLIWYKGSRRSIPHSMSFTQWHVMQQCIPGASKTKKARVYIYIYTYHIFIKFMTCDMVCNKAKPITHTHMIFCFSKAKNLHSVLWARHFHHKLPMEKSHSAKSRLKTSQKEAPLLPSKVSQRFKRSIVGLPTISWWHIHGGHSFGVENFFRHLINFTQKKNKFVNKCLFPQNYGNLRDSCWLPHRNLAPLFSHLHTNETNGSSFKVETQQWHQQIYPK